MGYIQQYPGVPNISAPRATGNPPDSQERSDAPSNLRSAIRIRQIFDSSSAPARDATRRHVTFAQPQSPIYLPDLLTDKATHRGRGARGGRAAQWYKRYEPHRCIIQSPSSGCSRSSRSVSRSISSSSSCSNGAIGSTAVVTVAAVALKAQPRLQAPTKIQACLAIPCPLMWVGAETTQTVAI